MRPAIGAPRTSIPGTVRFVQLTRRDEVVVQLSSSHGGVGVPASVTVPLKTEEVIGAVGGVGGSVTFPIRLNQGFATPSCAVITARTGTLAVRALLKIRPLAVIEN